MVIGIGCIGRNKCIQLTYDDNYSYTIKTLEKTEGATKNGQSKETGNIYGTQDEDKQNKNTTQYMLNTTLCTNKQI